MITIRYRRSALFARVAVLTAVSLAASPAAPLVQAQSGAKPAAPKAAAAPPASATQIVDGGWPRAYTTNSGAAMVLYQPQVAGWTNQKVMTAYAAASYTPKGATKPALGTLQIEADTAVSVAERLVDFSKYRVVEANFSTLPKEQTADRHRRGHHLGASAGARHRPRPRAGRHRQEPDHPEERRGREGRSAADLLQPDAGHPREHRRRSRSGARSRTTT